MARSAKIVGTDTAIAGIKLYRKEVQVAVGEVTQKHTKAIRNRAKATVPYSDDKKLPGEKHLRDKISVKMSKDKLTGRVLAGGKGAMHGNLVEGGAKAHDITVSKRRKVLSDGKRVFGRKVKHPGMAAQPFLKPALESESPLYRQDVLNIVMRVKP